MSTPPVPSPPLQTVEVTSGCTRVACVALIACAICVAYSNCFHGVFVLDDVSEIQQNPTFLNRESVWKATFTGHLLPARPLPYFTFYLNYLLHGDQTWGYHVVNLSIHLANSLLLFVLLSFCLNRHNHSAHQKLPVTLLAFSAAIIWGVHPIQTQSVTYIYQRIELLMSFFMISTLICLILSVNSARPLLWQSLSIAACAFGMGCKEVMVVAPLLAIWFDRSLLCSSWTELLQSRWRYYMALFSTELVLYYVVSSQRYDDFSSTLPDAHNGIQHLLSQPSVLIWYLRLCFWPTSQNLDYGWPPSRTLDHNTLPGLLILLGIIITIWMMRRMPRASIIPGSWLLLLAPTSSLIPVAAIAAEHRMYLPSAAVITGVVVLLWKLLASPILSFPPLTARVCFGLLVCSTSLAFGTLTHERNRLYHDRLAIWNDSANQAPKNWRAASIVGEILFERGKFAESEPYFERANKLHPCDLTHFSLASVKARLGKTSEAVIHFERTIELNAQYSPAYVYLGSLFRATDLERAMQYYQSAIRVNPQNSEAHNNLGAMLTTSDPKAAAEHFRAAIRGNSQSVQAYNNLANLLARQGDLPGAIRHYEHALAIDPTFAAARENLSSVRRQAGLMNRSREK